MRTVKQLLMNMLRGSRRSPLMIAKVNRCSTMMRIIPEKKGGGKPIGQEKTYIGYTYPKGK